MVKYGLILIILFSACTKTITSSGKSTRFGGFQTSDYPSDLNDSIMGQGTFTVKQMAKFLMNNNTNIDVEYAVKVAFHYVEEASKEDVNHDMAFSQMCLETSYLQFGNQVSAEQNNFCGLGATDDGAAGCKFNSIQIGVRAHIQHLKGYASEQYINEVVVDPRLKYVKRGSAPTLDDLAYKWASDGNYGEKIRSIIARIQFSE